MPNFDLDYLIINILLLTCFVYCGNRISKGVPYKTATLPCIFLFTLVQGCRYMRGNDYQHYTEVFNGDIPDTTGFLFIGINDTAKLLGFNAYSVFLIYSFVFILCAVYFLKEYKTYAKWTFPLFIMAYMQFEEYMIRQAFSYSFFFLYMNYLFKIKPENIKHICIKNKKHISLCIFWGIICLNIHSANIINILTVTGLYFFMHKPLHYNITIPIYLLCVYVLPKIFDFSILQPILNIFSQHNELASTYAENSSIWFSSEGMNNIYTRNTVIQIIEALGTSSLLYLGYKTICHLKTYQKRNATLFNSFFIGVCILSLFRNLEILNRIGQVLTYFWVFPMSLVLYYKTPKWSKFNKIACMFLVWFTYEYLKYLLFPYTGKTAFIWDAPFFISFF